MARTSRMLGKRRGGYSGGYGRTAKRRRFNKRSGNTRTGGLYRLRGQRRRGRMVRQQELKFKDRYVVSSAADPGNHANDANYTFFRAANTIPHPLGTGMITGMFNTCRSLIDYLPCGTNAYERIGRKIVIKSILLNLLATGNVTQADADTINCKLWLILDKQCNGNTATIPEIFGLPPGDPAVEVSVTAENITTCAVPYIANRQRFSILWESDWNFFPKMSTNGGEIQKVAKKIRMYKRMNLPVEYGGTTGALGEIKSNNLLLVFASSKTNGATHEPYTLIDGICRIRFADS